jgi:hypothetical protein
MSLPPIALVSSVIAATPATNRPIEMYLVMESLGHSKAHPLRGEISLNGRLRLLRRKERVTSATALPGFDETPRARCDRWHVHPDASIDDVDAGYERTCAARAEVVYPIESGQPEPAPYALREYQILLVAVVPVMRRVGQDRLGWTLDETCLAKHLPLRELLAGEVDLDPGGKSIPHVRHDPLIVEEHVRRGQFTADEIVDDETGHVAMALGGVVLRPAVVGIDGVGPPASPNRLFELSKRVHGAATLATAERRECSGNEA